MDANTDVNTLIEFLQFPLASGNPVIEYFAKLPGAVHRKGNNDLDQFVFIEGNRKNKVILVAHADTVWDENYGQTAIRQELMIEDDKIYNRHGGLGADDRAGCAIVWELRNLGHSLLIVNGEEHGQIGSEWLIYRNQEIARRLNQNHQFMVQFDRRNHSDFKCYNVGTDKFRKYITASTGYIEPDRNSYTDICTLCTDICGVNLSVGYYNEHTANEYIMAKEWQHTLDMSRKWLSENDLPKFLL